VDHGLSQRHLDPSVSVHSLRGSQKTWIPESNSLALRPGHRRHPNRSGSGIAQNPAAGTGRGPRGVNIVDQQNVPSSQLGRLGRKKSASQILPALVGGQACLTHRNSHAFQQTRFQLQHPLRVATARLDNRGTGKQLGMV
jgi:hypothetical protein